MTETEAETETAVAGVVVGVDGSARDVDAVGLASHEAALRGWPLHAVCVEEFAPPVLDVLAWTPAAQPTGARTLLDDAVEIAERAEPGVAVTASAYVGRPENVLHDLSRTAGLVVVGTGRKVGAARFVYGTVSLSVAAHAACPVLVIGEPASSERHGRVVVGVDGSRHSVRAVREGAVEARLREAELVIHSSWLVEVVDGLVVTEPDSPHWKGVEERLRLMQHDVVAEALGSVEDGLVVRHEVVHESAVEALVTASKQADIVVVGNRGRGGFLGKLLGSVTLGLLQRCHCPVLVTRER